MHAYPFDGVLDEAARHEVDEGRAPLVRLAEGRRRLGRDHENGSHGVDVPVGCLTLGHLQSRDAKAPEIRHVHG